MDDSFNTIEFIWPDAITTGADNYFVYEPNCENEFEIKELEFNLN